MNGPSQFPASEKQRLINEDRCKRQPVDVILKRMKLHKGEVVLDLGAGVGYLSLPMADAGAKVIALDLQQEMLDGLRERDNGSERIELVRAELPSIPLPDASADRAVLLNVFHEVEDKQKLADEIGRVLRKDGRLTIIDWQAKQTERGPPLHERVPVERAPSFFPSMMVEDIYNDDNYYHLELRHR
jgi:ubiquinone/menaquinone biosynthesis C-methylase UbiE